jgi:branched-chain amino acid transport system ATP-binding protein
VNPLLVTTGLIAFHGDLQALFGIDFEIRSGEVVAIIGANGAGKSTFLSAICGLLPVAPTQVVLDGEPIGGLPAHRIAARGLAMVPEGRRLFASLTVEENLLAGRHLGRAGPWGLPRVYDLFPALREKRHVFPEALSGGQQQMAAIGRALMSNPRLLICDEVSLGLAPVVVKGLYESVADVVRDGLAVIVVEQDVSLAQRLSSSLYCFQEGRVSLSGPSPSLTRAQISRAYFGVAGC